LAPLIVRSETRLRRRNFLSNRPSESKTSLLPRVEQRHADVLKVIDITRNHRPSDYTTVRVDSGSAVVGRVSTEKGITPSFGSK